MERDNLQENEGTERTPTLLDLPFLPLVKIYSYLSIHDIRSCALSCSYLRDMARQPAVWKDLYPIHWAFGLSQWNELILPPKQHKFSYKHNPTLVHRQWQIGRDSFPLTWLWDIVEYNLLSRMLEHLVPVVGHGVRELHLNDSGCLHDSMLRAMLVQCPNLSVLALKRTGVSPDVFSRLAEYGACRHLKNLDVSLTRVNASSLTSLAECWTDGSEDDLLPLVQMDEESLQVYNINGDDYGLMDNKTKIMQTMELIAIVNITISEDKIKTIPFPNVSLRKRGRPSGLKVLDVSGCPLDDSAVAVLRNCRVLVENLEWLDVSGCVRLTSAAISEFVLSCPKLKAENLFYCSHINGPYAKTTNGCSKLSERSCCDKYS